MIIFYAFTAMQLINMYNIRSNFYIQEDAVLYLELGSRIPIGIIKQIEESNKFKEIIIMDNDRNGVDIVSNINCFSKYVVTIEKIYSFLKSIHIISRQMSYIGALVGIVRHFCKFRYFFNFLRKNEKINYCNEIFVGTCGRHSPMIINIVLKKVKKLVVNLVDEGTVNYDLSKEKICFECKNSKLFYDILLCKFYHLNKYFFEKLFEITEKSYLLQPSACLYLNQYVLKKIPQVNSDNFEVFSLLRNSVSQSDIEMYKEKHVYYMLQNPGEEFEKCLSIILEQINHSELLLKEHPWIRIMDSLSKEYDLASVVIDKRTDAFIFEALYTHYNFDDRVIITNYSSSAFMPKFMFGSEPSVIFLYKLINRDSEKNVPFDSMVESLKKLYLNPEKIFVPKTFDELSSVLIAINKCLVT